MPRWAMAADTTHGRPLLALELHPVRGGLARQSLDTRGEPMAALQEYDVSALDLDGDGWRELRLRHQFGSAANTGHEV